MSACRCHCFNVLPSSGGKRPGGSDGWGAGDIRLGFEWSSSCLHALTGATGCTEENSRNIYLYTYFYKHRTKHLLHIYISVLKYIKIIILRLAKNYILIEVNIISALYRNPLKYFSLSAWKPKEMGQNGRDSAFSLANCLKSTQQWQMANGDGDEGNDGAGNGDDDGDGGLANFRFRSRRCWWSCCCRCCCCCAAALSWQTN